MLIRETVIFRDLQKKIIYHLIQHRGCFHYWGGCGSSHVWPWLTSLSLPIIVSPVAGLSRAVAVHTLLKLVVTVAQQCVSIGTSA